MDIFDYLIFLPIALVVLVIVFAVTGTNNYNHKPCEWFLENNYAIGDVPVRCNEYLIH